MNGRFFGIKAVAVSVMLVSVLLSGCTSVQVSPVSAEHSVQRVAIQNNPEVSVPHFLSVVRNRFEDHGITTVMFQEQIPTNCQAILTYTARRSWDFWPYLSHAELTLRSPEGERIGYAEYHLNGKGGLDLTKWKSVKSKMNPVVDQLLSEYK